MSAEVAQSSQASSQTLREGHPRFGDGLLAFADVPKARPAPVDNTTPFATRKTSPAPAPRTAPAPARELVSEPAHTFKFPPLDAPDLDAAWDDFFANNRPPVRVVGGQLLKLHSGGHHKQVIAALRAALINGQAQPWMYHALAGSMQIEKYPKEEVERVLLSMTDFGEANFESMIYSAAQLVRFDRLDTALKMYQQASRMAPESPEPYILCLEHTGKFKQPEDIQWAACGVLRYDWTPDRAANTKTALSVIATLQRDLQKSGNQAALESLRTAVAEAQATDLQVDVVWNGTGDVDLEVEEPSGSICSLTQLQTSSGGYHLGDGYGPRQQDCHETYVCPSGFSGEYRIRVKPAFGDIVGRRATVTITTHKGTPAESTETKNVVFKDGAATTTVRLENGRRQQPRMVQETRPVRQSVTQRPAAKIRRDANVIPAAGQAGPPGATGFVTGAVGFQPNIQVINEGVSLGVSALISPDRRYVRMGISPVFSNITDVFTFSVFGGSPTAFGTSPPAGAQPNP
jgi:hypothetical protein